MVHNHEVYYPLYENQDKFIILVTGGRGCEAPDTPVMMSDMSVKQIKDIVVGDKVMGDDGQPREVLRTVRGRSMMYKVHQANAEDYVVNDSHIISVKKLPSAMLPYGPLTKKGTPRHPNGRYPQYGEYADIPIREFAESSDKFRNTFYGYKVGSIPYKKQNVLINPYLLGLWLGDGTAIYPRITNGDVEVKEWIENYCAEHGQKFVCEFKQGAYHMGIIGDGRVGHNPFLNALTQLDLLNNKHIPQEYISNSEEVRLELLAGLMDTDGSYDSKGDYEITQKREDLARQIKLVADTLGFRTSIGKKRASIGSKDCGIYYRIIISGDIDRIPCRVERKKAKSTHYSRRSHLVSHLTITALGEGEYCGIMIDGNHRYLHADGTVTHNSGKSFGVGTFIERLTFELGRHMDKKVAHQVLYTRYTMTSASISVIPEFMEKIDADGTSRYFSTSKSDVTNLMTGSKVMFRGIKTSSGNQTAKLKSIKGLTVFVCDEAEEWTSEKEFETIMFSIRQMGLRNLIIIIMNPSDSNHFIYEKYIKDTHKIVEYDGVLVQISTHPNVLHIHTSYLDNIEHLSEQFLKEAQAMKENNPERYGHIFMGRWADTAEGVIFKKWGIVDEFPAECKRVRTVADWGYVNDPSAILRCGIVGNRLYVDEEVFQAGMLTGEIAKVLKRMGYMVIAESADQRLLDEIALYGVVIYGVQKGPGSIIAGIEKMLELELYVTRRSVNVQDELRKYSWAKDENGKFTNEPEDKNNHCFVADTKVLTKEGEKDIIDVKVGDMVLTSNGYRRVTRFFDNGSRNVLHTRLVFENETIEISATADHKFKTTKGWKQLKDMKANDVLYLYKSLKGKSINSIKVSDTSQEEQIGCMKPCGDSIMVKYLKGFMSITKTKIHGTTISQILNSSRRTNICGCMQKNLNKQKDTERKPLREWIGQGLKQTSGMRQQKVSNGTKNMELRLQRKSNLLRWFVNNVASIICLNQTERTDSVLMRAKVRGEEPTTSMMLRNDVSGVERCFITTNTPSDTTARTVNGSFCLSGTSQCQLREQIEERLLVRMEVLSESVEHVYDIEVEGEHEFFANGVLVHNCIDAIRYYVLGELLGKVMQPKKVKSKAELGIF